MKPTWEEIRKMVRDAYNEGFTEGMREDTSRDGGKPWEWSTARKLMDARTSRETEEPRG